MIAGELFHRQPGVFGVIWTKQAILRGRMEQAGSF